MKRIVNFLLIAVIAYCFCMWVFFGLSFFISLNTKAYVVEGILTSSAVAIATAIFISSKIKYAKYEVTYNEKSSFIDTVNHEMEELGFEQKSFKDNRIKYRSFVWFSLIDPKINVRIKNRKAVIKGRKRDVDNLMNRLNIQL